jgi:hypothetical protein
MSTPTKRLINDILVVSEDPAFIVRVQEMLRDNGVEVRGCLGPANNPCALKLEGVCPLAQGADVVIVDSPRSGSFLYEWASMPAGDYAERLARTYPSVPVILCGAPEGSSGGVGEVTNVENRAAAVDFLLGLLDPAEVPV